jgi:hypothetical protein
MTAWTEPVSTVRERPLRIGFSPTLAVRSLITRSDMKIL